MELQSLTNGIEKVSEKYAAEFSITRDTNWFILKLQEELGELTQAYLMASGQARRKNKSDLELTKNLHAEVADVLCHTLLLAKQLNVDLEAEIEEKWLSRIK